MADAQPAFPSRRSQRQAVRDAHVPQPIPAPEEAPAAQQAPIPMPEPPVPPVPLPPPPSAVDAGRFEGWLQHVLCPEQQLKSLLGCVPV